MASSKKPRESADAAYRRIQKAATEQSDNELAAVRKKTARLKTMRLEKQAAEQPAPSPAKKLRHSRKKSTP
jgi:hypothetical protein